MDNPPDDGPCQVTITAPEQNWLQAFVHELVANRLAAAAHVDHMRTTYRWQNTIEHAGEARAVLHTVSSRLPEIVRRVRAEHPYEVPCVVASPITGDSTYLSWIVREANDLTDESQ